MKSRGFRPLDRFRRQTWHHSIASIIFKHAKANIKWNRMLLSVRWKAEDHGEWTVKCNEFWTCAFFSSKTYRTGACLVPGFSILGIRNLSHTTSSTIPFTNFFHPLTKEMASEKATLHLPAKATALHLITVLYKYPSLQIEQSSENVHSKVFAYTHRCLDVETRSWVWRGNYWRKHNQWISKQHSR